MSPEIALPVARPASYRNDQGLEFRSYQVNWNSFFPDYGYATIIVMRQVP